MNESSITKYITSTFPGAEVLVASQASGAPEVAWGDSFFFYDPDHNIDANLKFPFATIVTKDYPAFDYASNLDRPGIFRLNIGVSKETYRSLIGPEPPQPGESGAVDTGHDFTALDQLMPHPVYAPQSWISVLNPSEETFEKVKPLLAEAYNMAVRRQDKRSARESTDS